MQCILHVCLTLLTVLLLHLMHSVALCSAVCDLLHRKPVCALGVGNWLGYLRPCQHVMQAKTWFCGTAKGNGRALLTFVPTGLSTYYVLPAALPRDAHADSDICHAVQPQT